MREQDVGIIGAGISGLVAGILLMQQGHRVRLFEQAPEIREVGAGLSVPPNAAYVISQMGLSGQLKAASNLPDCGRIINGKTGEIIKLTPFGEEVKKTFGDYYYQLHRADMIDILRRAALDLDPDCILTDHHFTNYIERDEAITLQFDGQADAETGLLIGADGARSAVRKQMRGDDPSNFTGYVVWRALIPMENLPDYYRQNQSSVWIGKGRNATFYPLRHGKLLNCVFFASDQDWTAEGWSLPAHPGEIRTAYHGYHERLHTLIDAMPENAVFKWGLFDRDPIERWTDGKVAIIGDAAHPMLPFLGQGASMAIEDAAALASALKTTPSIDEAFQHYQTARKARANWVLEESRAAGKRFVADNPTGDTFGEDGAMKAKELFGYRTPSFA